MLLTEKRLRQRILRQGNQARDRGDYNVASALYEAVLQFSPDDAAIHIQCGHMHKEAGSLAMAERHYNTALQLVPNDPDLALQLGHFEKLLGRYGKAAEFYSKALSLDPQMREATTELEHIQKFASRSSDSFEADTLPEGAAWMEMPELFGTPGGGFISPELVPVSRDDLLIDFHEEFVLTRLGCGQRTRWADGPTLRGIDAIRGHIYTIDPLLSIEIYIDGLSLGTFPLKKAPIRRARSRELSKYVFNAWLDFTNVAFGRHEVIMRANSLSGKRREGVEWRRERVVVAEPVSEQDYGYSDGVLPPLANDGRSLEEQVNSAPSIVHLSSTRSFPAKLDNILVLRTDQLGDMTVSVPAMRRLRELLPAARIVGLLTAANAELAQTLALFDEIIVIDFPDDPEHRRRVIDLTNQVKLRKTLASYKFDLAIDLAVSGVSNKLMTLSGAPYSVGFGLGGAQWMTLGIDMATHDIRSNNDFMQHSARTRLLVEALGVWLESGAKVVRREDLDPAVLQPYGIAQNEPFALLHGGARIVFSRWPHFAELANRIYRELGLKVVFLADDPGSIDGLSPDIIREGGIICIEGKIAFDHFDALASFCSVFVGNDSGPKHIASLRGAKVVSIHSARTSWKEWGQELGGVIISRKVPCAGCSIHHEPEECAKDFACVRNIRLAEVFAEVSKLIERDHKNHN